MWWYLTRSTGIVAGVAVVASVMMGLTFSARNVPRSLRPAWWVDLHRWMGGMSLLLTGAHIAAVVLDRDSGLGVAAALLPEKARALTRGITWGVVSFWLLVIVVLTTWPKRRLRLMLWRPLHLLAVPATYFFALHTFAVGTDANHTWVIALAASCVPLVAYPLALRLLTPVIGRTRPARTLTTEPTT